MTRWAALIAALLAAGPAQAQCLGFQCPPGVLGAGASGAPALPLDGFTTLSGAYSFRKLKSTYTGPAVRIRRASDNLETDINFLGFVPGIGAPWDEAAANAHCAATTCWMRTWPDQSGLARDVVETVSANQPQLIFNCFGTLPCARTINATTSRMQGVASVTPSTGVASISVVARRTGTGNCSLFRPTGLTSARVGGQSAVANSWILAATSLTLAVAAVDGAPNAALGVVNGASSSLTLNANAPVTGTINNSVVAGTPGFSGSAATTCDLGEAVGWDAYVVTTGETTALIANQRGFWGF